MTNAQFWPPQRGDIWISDLAEAVPKTWPCHDTGWLHGTSSEFTAEDIAAKYGPLRLIWRDGRAITANHVSELGHASVNVEVTDSTGVHIHAGIRQITSFDVPDAEVETDLAYGVLHMHPKSILKFLTDQEIEEIAYEANETAAAAKEG